MTCNPSPFPLAVLAEATRITPGRRISSDGICAGPHEGQGDHYPDSRGIPHAVDISQSTPGSPFWSPSFAVFDAHAYGLAIAGRIAAGTETRVKYLVSNYGHGDVIFDPAVSMSWRQNGAFKNDHLSHLHVSFNYTLAAEQSTAPFFQVEDDVTPQDKADIVKGVVDALVTTNPDGTQQGVLPSELKRYLHDPVFLGLVADAVVGKLPK